MKLPRQLTKRQLVQIVERIRDWLYMDEKSLQEVSNDHGIRLAEKLKKAGPLHGKFYEFLNPDKEWCSAADILEGINYVLMGAHLTPTKCMTADEAYRKPTPNENWKNDSIQFPRLLEEIQAAGVLTLLMNSPSTSAQPPGSRTVWEELQANMDLTSQEIMQIFDRAQKEWDRIKKETK